MGLVSELRRRNVFRMALLYLGAAWLIMQVVDLLIDRGPLPESIGPITLTVLAIGFPIALIVSWFYELTPEGVSLDTDERSAEPAAGFAGRRVDFVIISVLAAAVLVFAYDKWWTGPPPERSVAVLPFANMSADEENSYLAAGITDTILHGLAQIPGLLVTARTTTELDRLKELSIREIGALIGVAVILEGSVQRQGDRLRITAQLINAEDESHLWSGNFDRDYGDVFAIQDEIAEAVTSALELSLQGETKRRIDREGTDNLHAFEEYSKAIENLRSTTTESVERAAQQLERTIKLDPNFARAHARLGYTYLMSPRAILRLELDGEEIRARARDAANTALRIAPGMSTALALLGELTDDLDAKGELFREAAENGPNDTLALTAYARYLRRHHSKYRSAEASVLVQKAIRLNPFDEANYVELAWVQSSQKQTHAALETIRRGKEKIPDSVVLRDIESIFYFSLGDYRSAIVAKYETLEVDPREWWNRFDIAHFYLVAGMPDEAERWIESAAAHEPEGGFIHRLNPTLLDMYYQRNDQKVFAALKWLLSNAPGVTGYEPVHVSFIEYGSRLGKLDEVLETLEERYPLLFVNPPSDLDSGISERLRQTFYVGLALLRHGDVQRGEPLMRLFLEKFEYPRVILLARGAADLRPIEGLLALDEADAALETFRQFDATDQWANAHFVSQLMFRYSSLYNPIRDEPEFIALLDEYDKNAAEQRKLLTEMAHELPVK